MLNESNTNNIIFQFNSRIIILALKRLNDIFKNEIKILNKNEKIDVILKLQRDKTAIFNYLNIQSDNIINAINQSNCLENNETNDELKIICDLMIEMKNLQEEFDQILERKYYISSKIYTMILNHIKKNQINNRDKSINPSLLRLNSRKWVSYTQTSTTFTDEIV
ncbi:hypothetical protein [Lyticum sinuosum]|uniref:Uncharacterized protein n=1 Tax=Lyticum sinuosum TaxID=1332059 RepID=A0AAE5AI03_9RICK|nr:hypothetical protein [Lyticum sinuosum]MDZ5761419.1 hypothetical protein [Lyticum sinuosum]